MQLKWKFTLLVSVTVFALGVSAYLKLTVNEIKPDIRFHFSKESDYQNYVMNSVRLDGIAFTSVVIDRGDNFWTVARRHNINIDSLIGVNPYWDDLFARINQTVVIPSENGVLEFINDYSEIEELKEEYGVDDSFIIVEDKPSLYKYYYKYEKNRKPIAVFIKSVKPRVEIMTAKLAVKFEERELFRSPLGGRLSSFFGGRQHPIFKKHRFHNGLDIAARRGTYIGAAREGRVVSTGWNGGYGKAVIVEHDKGYRTLYGHMSSILVKAGQYVKAGRVIGRVGSTGLSTGPHLHFTIWKNGKLINPLNVLW